MGSRQLVLVAVGALLSLTTILPVAAHAAPDPFFGTLSDDNLSLTRAQLGQDFDRQAAAGIGTIRHHLYWDRIEKQWTSAGAAGVYDWAVLDQVVGDAAQRGLRILPMIVNTPQFYKPAGTSPNAQAPPANPQYLGRFARAMAQRYGPNGTFWCSLPPLVCKTPNIPITAWQIWNEPNYPSWWGGTPDPAAYVNLLRQAYTDIKLADPNAEVVAAGLAPTTTTNDTRNYVNFLNGMYDAGAAPYFDTLAIHAYGPDVPTTVENPTTVRQIANAHNDPNTPIWITEFGWATAGSGSALIKTIPCQAALIHAAATEWKRLRTDLKLRGAVQFQWRDVPTTATAWPYHAGLNPSTFSAPAKPSLAQYVNAIAGRPPDAGYSVASACGGTNPPEDKALRRPATASSVKTGTGWGPELGVDGSSSTRWSSAWAQDNQWWQVDLGAARQVDKVTINWFTSYATRYLISTSTDGTNFTQAADVTLNSAGPKTTTFAARAARYVRITGVTRASPVYGISFWDVNVYGPSDTAAKPKALVVVKDAAALEPGDAAVKSRLESQLGYAVTVKSQTAGATDAAGMDVVLISASVAADTVGAKFRTVAVPVMTWESLIYDDMGMTAANGGNFTGGQTAVKISSASHPMAAALTGTPTTTTAANTYAWGVPAAAATKVATLAGDTTKSAIFAYGSGAAMSGLNAPARRVGFFFSNATPTLVTADGWKLFDAAVKWTRTGS